METIRISDIPISQLLRMACELLNKWGGLNWVEVSTIDPILAQELQAKMNREIAVMNHLVGRAIEHTTGHDRAETLGVGATGCCG